MAEVQNLLNAGEAARTALHTGGMTEMRRNLSSQGSIHFVIDTLRRSQVPEQADSPACILMVPTRFSRKHSDKFQNPIYLRNGASTRPCTSVRLRSVKNSDKELQYKLGRGWRTFATYNELGVGDGLIFELTARSEFKVHIFRRMKKANAEVYSSHDPKKYCYLGSGLPQENGFNDASGRAACSSHQQLAVDRSAGSADGVRVWIAQRAIGQEGVVSSSPSTLRNSSSITVLQASRTEIVQIPDSPERRSGSQESQEPHALDHQELNVPEIPARRNACAQVTDARMTQNKEVQPPQAKDVQPPQAIVSLPSFTQRLVFYNVQDTVGNICGAYFEVPYSFVMTHGKQLQAAHVHLQGIREYSPVRPVTACYYNVQKDGELSTKRLLRLGWGDFVRENALRAGQELVFTLAAESYFIVREVSEIIVL